MKIFWTSFFVALTFVAGLNFYVDPAHHWHTGIYEFHELWGNKDCRVLPSQMDEVLLKKRLIGLIDKPEVVLFGSSRGLQINSSMFDPSIKFFNASVSGSDLWNYTALWEVVKASRKIPESLILFLDPSQFRESKFIDPPSTKIQRTIRSVKDFFNDLQPKELINWALLKETVTQLMSKSSPDVVGKIVSAPFGVPSGFNCERRDGSLIYHDGNGERVDLENIRQTADPAFGKDNWVYQNFIQRHISSVDAYEKFIASVRSQGTKVYIIIPPIQNEVYSSLFSKDEARAGLSDIQKFADMISARTDVVVCDRIDPVSIPCKKNEFMDSWHMQTTCGRKLIKSCLPELAGRERHL